MITIVFKVLLDLLFYYRWIVILAALFSMLASFGVLDTRNRMVWTVGDVLYRLTEPALRPIRSVLPMFGNLDFSPLVLILIISALQEFLPRIYAAIVYGNMQGLLL